MMNPEKDDASAAALAFTFTYFPKVTQTRGRAVTRSLAQVARWWAAPPPSEGELAGDKRALSLWSAATFRGGERAGANVERVTALVLDFDGVQLSLAEAGAALPCACLGHTSWSHGTGDKPGHCFRLLVALDRSISTADHARLWRLFAATFRERGAEVDAKARDAGRAWFVPCASEHYQVAAWLDREPLDVDQALTVAPREPTASAAAPVMARQVGHVTPSVIERARRYLARKEPSIAGSGGDQALWNAAIALTRGFGLSEAEAFTLLAVDFNPRCQPPWPTATLARKVHQAARADRVGEGYLLTERRNAS